MNTMPMLPLFLNQMLPLFFNQIEMVAYCSQLNFLPLFRGVQRYRPVTSYNC